MKIANKSHALMQHEQSSWALKTAEGISDSTVQHVFKMAVETVETASKTAATQYRLAQEDTTLSDVGLQAQAQTIADQARTSLKGIDRAFVRLDEEITTLEDEMVLDQPDIDPTLEYLQQMELRQRLNEKTPQEIHALYERAVNAGEDSPLVRALETDPLPRGFITEQSKAQSRYNRIKNLYPKQLQSIDKLNTARHALTKYAGTVTSLLN